MRTKEDTVYYSNPEGKNSRIARDFTSAFMHEFSEALKAGSATRFIRNFRIPNERELYGLCIKAFIQAAMVDGQDFGHLGHIGTELQISRLNKATGVSTDGRLDVMIEYKKRFFLIELKVCRSSLRSLAETARVKKLWEGPTGAHTQAVTIKLDQEPLKTVLGKSAPILCPIVIYFHYDLGQHASGDAEALHTAHQNILRQLDNKPGLHFRTTFDQPLITRRRANTTAAMSDNLNSTVFGFSILASVLPA